MKKAVARSPNIALECMGKKLASLLDSENMVILVQHSCLIKKWNQSPLSEGFAYNPYGNPFTRFFMWEIGWHGECVQPPGLACKSL